MSTTDKALLIGALSGAFIALVGALHLILKGMRSVIEFRDDIREFLLDWRGRPAKGNAPGTLGVVDRISTIEQQLRPNGGQSVYDKVTQVRNVVVPSQRQGE